jgi:hypothetical protein
MAGRSLAPILRGGRGVFHYGMQDFPALSYQPSGDINLLGLHEPRRAHTGDSRQATKLCIIARLNQSMIRTDVHLERGIHAYS